MPRRIRVCAFLLLLACTETVRLEPPRVSGSGGSGLGSGGMLGTGGAGPSGSGGAGVLPCHPGGDCSREGAVCADSCTRDATTSNRCMCIDDGHRLVWACGVVWCGDAGIDRRCPDEGSPCQPPWGMMDCCVGGYTRYCTCPEPNAGAFGWRCKTISAYCE